MHNKTDLIKDAIGAASLFFGLYLFLLFTPN